MNIRASRPEDLPEIERVYAAAREFMKKTGNPRQWGDKSPEKALILSDFENSTGYVVENEGKIAGVFAFIPGIDPTYGYIEGGAWLNDGPYGTIHRIASDGSVHGILEEALSFCEKRAENIRIDTHEDNKVMQHLLSKHGFTRCGIIYLLNGEPRIAYQKVINIGNS